MAAGKQKKETEQRRLTLPVKYWEFMDKEAEAEVHGMCSVIIQKALNDYMIKAKPD